MTRYRSIIATATALAALAVPAAANAADRDHDHMRDSWEKHFKLNTHRNDARKDKDRDGLKNLTEFRAGTNPRKRDTDGDGVRDDREGAGTIKSFDAATGALVVDLFDSDQDLTGKVDATTKIECEDESHAATHARDGADDNSGPGNAGEDNSGPGNAHEDGDREHGDDDDPDEACGPEALVAGRTVKEAELNQGDDGPADVFDEIELIVR
jgi:opacity protein-like surface antigen